MPENSFNGAMGDEVVLTVKRITETRSLLVKNSIAAKTFSLAGDDE